MATYITTALGRDVPAYEAGTVLQDLVLKVLFDFRMSPFNGNNVPLGRMALSMATRISPQEVDAVAEALHQEGKVERIVPAKGEPSYKITGPGVVFVRNMPQGLQSLR